MPDFMLCSNCFTDQGLRLDAERMGRDEPVCCPQCKTDNGKKLDKERIRQLAYRFFVQGTILRLDYGGAPRVQFNEHHHGSTAIQVSEWLQKDIELIENSLQVGFFPYGPRLWMLGEVEPLKDLQDPSKRQDVVKRILTEYPEHVLKSREIFYRLRRNPKSPEQNTEYDSPPSEYLGTYRLDSPGLPILYGSQDLEVCIHECRVTIEDDLFVATLETARDLRLLDLTEVIREECTEFESLDMTVHMLFLAGSHSYAMSRDIASAARDAGFDGLIYPSYFSLVRTGTIPFETAYGLSVRRFEGHVVIDVDAGAGPPAQIERFHRQRLQRGLVDGFPHAGSRAVFLAKRTVIQLGQQLAQRRLSVIVPVTLFLIFLILYSMFGSMKWAVLIAANIARAPIGGVIALYLTHTNFSVSSGVGFLALFGVSVQTGVIMVEYINQLRARGHTVLDAAREGAVLRLRPIMMTMLVATLGLLPAATSHGIGSDSQRPFAIVIVGGLITALMMSIYILPTLYVWCARDNDKLPVADPGFVEQE